MGGFANDALGNTIVWADNIDFSGNVIPSRAITANGQLLIGSTVSPNIKPGTITSPLGTITIGYFSPNITIDVAGGAAPIEKINLQTGSSPIIPTGGTITFNGATVAAGTNPVRTDGTGPNTMAVEVQISQAIASTDATKIGLCNFNSAQFSVDANGFVSLASGGFTWNNVTTTSATMVKENGYQSNNAGLVTLTMPSVASSTFGDTIKIAGFGAGGWLIQCVATQLIHLGSSATTAAGSLASTNRYDQIELVCSSTTTEWFVRYAVGNITIA